MATRADIGGRRRWLRSPYTPISVVIELMPEKDPAVRVIMGLVMSSKLLVVTPLKASDRMHRGGTGR